jgi:hypothetical protein
VRHALYYQNFAYQLDSVKTSYATELNNLSNQIKVLNDSSVNGITYLVNDINTNGIGAPAYLVRESYKVNHTHVPGTAGSITHTFKNYGTEPQTNVSFKISQPTEGFVVTSADSIYVGTIQPDETKQVTFSFMSPAATDSFTIGRYEIDVKAANGSVQDVTGLLYILKASSVLPVTLTTFENTCTNAGVKLTWQTASEINSSHFDVENSSNGTTWTTIGTTKATGTGAAKKDYQFIDVKGAADFYRLKQVDKDGRFTYSATQKANCKPKEASVHIYPVPARTELNVVINAGKSSKVDILLVDVFGRVGRKLNTDLKQGKNNLHLNVNGLAAGQYFLKIVGAEFMQTQKVMITQ